MQPGPKIELAAERLGADVEKWVTDHRRDDRSWQWISNRLAQETGVQVTAQYLGRLYADADQPAESGAA